MLPSKTGSTAASATAATESSPAVWSGVERVVAFADVHGAYAEITALLQSVQVVDPDLRWTGGKTHLVSVGDLLDRGGYYACTEGGVNPPLRVLQRDAEPAAAARSVLSTCLDLGLRLLSPFMPFITEELWQRLPRPEDQISALPPSICIASYPSHDDASRWRNDKLEKDMENIQSIVRTVRSARSSYLIPNKTKTKLTLRCNDPEVSRSFISFIPLKSYFYQI